MARYIALIDEKTDGSSLEMTEYKTITEAAEAAFNLWSRLTKPDKKDRRIMAGIVDRETSDIISYFWTSEADELTEDDIIDAGDYDFDFEGTRIHFNIVESSVPSDPADNGPVKFAVHMSDGTYLCTIDEADGIDAIRKEIRRSIIALLEEVNQ